MTASPIDPKQRSIATPGDGMLTLEETCALLRLPEGTLRYWRQIGAGPRSFKLGRHVRYWKTDLLLWLSEQTKNPPQHAQQRVSPQITRFDSQARHAQERD